MRGVKILVLVRTQQRLLFFGIAGSNPYRSFAMAFSSRASSTAGMPTGQTRSHSPQPMQRPARCIARVAWNIHASSVVAFFAVHFGSMRSQKHVSQ